MDIQIKIKEYIRENKISFREFAKMAEMPNSTLQSICERGIGSASFLNAGKIAKVLGVSISDFQSLGGEISQREQAVLSGFRALDERGKTSVEAVIQNQKTFALSKEVANSFAFADKKPSSYIQISRRKPQTRTLKVFLQPACAGLGSYVDDEYFEEVELENVPTSADFGVRISGDSMTPLISDGEIVFVKKQDAIQPGEIGIYVIGGDAFCKKLISKPDGAYLHSLNEKYRDFPVPEDAYLVGKVII